MIYHDTGNAEGSESPGNRFNLSGCWMTFPRLDCTFATLGEQNGAPLCGVNPTSPESNQRFLKIDGSLSARLQLRLSRPGAWGSR